ncbi:hypothetical protein GCM10010371_04470 [Streptomyces subrutilus]|nr:hypothetical protein [Streptomyces subrutilus]GGZ48165.1 hypothetical protein GCM10010371_04470 [Streptomyces subrutilus]
MTSVASQSTTTVAPITPNSAPSGGVSWLKWLRLPRTAWPVITAISATAPTTTTMPAHQPVLRHRVGSEYVQARVSA